MEYAEFESRVAQRAGIPVDEVEAAAEATLATLSERLPDDESRAVAEQLPEPASTFLTAADGRQSFGYDEYLARVGERMDDATGVERAAAERRAQTVVAVLLDAADSETTDDLLSYLSPDYEPLLELVEPEAVWGPGWRERLGEQW
ncbi:MAG: DUF2267 domain-containing protein [Halobacteriaceae archaeon]